MTLGRHTAERPASQGTWGCPSLGSPDPRLEAAFVFLTPPGLSWRSPGSVSHRRAFANPWASFLYVPLISVADRPRLISVAVVRARMPCRITGRTVAVTVRDSGPGFP